ncbi:MAG: 4Fe-4S ferredoxin [Sedimenticola sp.]|nr:4Fe-4S ferredoxin [Sedimenticola sp.]
MSESVTSDSQATNLRAREAAQRAMTGVRVESTGLVEFTSRGRVVVIGGPAAGKVAAQLPKPLQGVALLTSGSAAPDTPVTRLQGRSLKIEGHLGAFTLNLGEPGQPDAAVLKADLVLDLGDEPRLRMPMTPPGYLVASPGQEGLERAREQLVDLVGTFDKPRYFSYDSDICAHGRSGKVACTRCIDVCPAEAITSLVDRVAVDSHRCQGGGACGTVCPSGAIRYYYPRPEDTLEQLRILLKTYREQGGSDPLLLLSAAGQETSPQLPGNVLVLEVEEVASVGLEGWLAALAYGARSVMLLDNGRIPETVVQALEQQLDTARTLLAGMGYPESAVGRVNPDVSSWQGAAGMPSIKPANFSTRGGKRQLVYMALDHLYGQAERPHPLMTLPVGAPFGMAQVEANACTLCFSCVGACPGGALLDGDGEPRLRFIEANCLQCGMCTRTCPEDAISITPRMLYQHEARTRVRQLHEEAPFCCVECGKPYATRTVVDNMLQKLEGHWMFRDPRARRRLKMCQDCRVIDIAQDAEAMGPGLGSEVRQ